MPRRKEHTIRNIGYQRVENKRPSQGICQSFAELIPLEVLVANTLLIDTNTLNGKNAVFLAQPTSVELVVGHSEQENNANNSS
jgi:hypothetical protein